MEDSVKTHNTFAPELASPIKGDTCFRYRTHNGTFVPVSVHLTTFSLQQCPPFLTALPFTLLSAALFPPTKTQLSALVLTKQNKHK